MKLASEKLKEFCRVGKKLGGGFARITGTALTAVGDAGTVTARVEAEGTVDAVVDFNLLAAVPLRADTVELTQTDGRLAVAGGGTVVRLATQDPGAVEHLPEVEAQCQLPAEAFADLVRRAKPFIGGPSTPSHLQSINLAGGRLCAADGMRFFCANLEAATVEALLPPKLCQSIAAIAKPDTSIGFSVVGQVAYFLYAGLVVRSPLLGGKFPVVEHFDKMPTVASAAVAHAFFNAAVKELTDVFGSGAAPVAVDLAAGELSVSTPEADASAKFSVVGGEDIKPRRFSIGTLADISASVCVDDFVVHDLGPAYPVKFTCGGVSLYTMPLR